MFCIRFKLLVATGFVGVVAQLEAASPVYTAAEVVEYHAGAGVVADLTDPHAALTLPSASTGTDWWDGNLSPFNPHYRAGEIVQVGHGGQLTLRLERFVRVAPGQRHLGVWENVMLVAASGGLVSHPVGLFGADSAVVEVSANGTDFVSVGMVRFDMFGNYWADSAGPYSQSSGTVPADFGRPFTADPTVLGGTTYARVLEFLEGTAGGTWIDLSPSGLEQVGWVRFSGVGEGLTLEIDAVTINTSLAGEPTVVPSLIMDHSSTGRLVLTRSLPHARYQFQVSDNLAAGWQNYGEAVPGTGGELVFTDATTPRPTTRFYRVVLP